MRYLLKLRKELDEVAIDVSLLNSIANHDKECHIEVLATPHNHELLTETPQISKLHVWLKSKIADHILQYNLLRQSWDAVLITRRAQPLQLFYRPPERSL